jgi:ABC-2 type transport system ATP-binding protein
VGKNVIQVNAVTKRFQNRVVLERISMDVRDSEIVGLAGANGAGKTTLMRIMTGLMMPDSGDVLIDKYSVLRDRSRALIRTAWVPEISNMDPMDSPWILFNEFGSMFGYGREQIRSKSEKCMKQVSLEGVMRRPFSSFSNGMKKRFLIALSLFQNAHNYLLDETFAGIDPVGSALLRDLIIYLRDQGCSILLSSHILSELEDLSDRVTIINSGRISGTFDLGEMSGSVMTLRSRSNPDKVLKILLSFGSVSRHGNVYTVRNSNIMERREDVMKALKESEIDVLSISFGTEKLQDIFMRSMESDE